MCQANVSNLLNIGERHTEANSFILDPSPYFDCYKAVSSYAYCDDIDHACMCSSVMVDKRSVFQSLLSLMLHFFSRNEIKYPTANESSLLIIPAAPSKTAVPTLHSTTLTRESTARELPQRACRPPAPRRPLAPPLQPAPRQPPPQAPPPRVKQPGAVEPPVDPPVAPPPRSRMPANDQ